jgi:hypothetical protein
MQRYGVRNHGKTEEIPLSLFKYASSVSARRNLEPTIHLRLLSLLSVLLCQLLSMLLSLIVLGEPRVLKRILGAYAHLWP